MPQHTTPRQPLSCENCRKRKIKCTGGTIPCNTCIRRGYRHSCYLKKLTDNSSQAVPDTSELLYRIQNLEDLLERQTSYSPRGPPESERSSAMARTDLSSNSVISEPLPMGSPFKQSGSIITSSSGHQHFALHSLIATECVNYETATVATSPTSATNFPFTTESVASREALLDGLPPLRQCDELKNIFFEVFSPLFHILHDPTFNTVYEDFRSNPASVSLSWLALLFVVLGVAVTALDEKHPLLHDLGREPSAIANRKKLSAKYRSAAMQCLTADQFLYQHNLQTVQTLVLLIYAMNHANVPSWTLLGMTWNIAVRIGCHIDPSSLDLGVVEGEERRRCWAALMMLYTVQNTCLGNIAPQIFTANVQLPADIDDEDIHDTKPISTAISHTRRRPTKMSYILYKFKLYRIAADICQLSAQHGRHDEQTVLALDRQLSIEEEEHLSRFSIQELPTYHIAHHYILQSYTHHLYLVLHRPMLNVENIGQEGTLHSQQRCRTSAIKILEIHKTLCETEAFKPYQWYVYGLGSFHAFLAVSVMIALMCKPATLTDNDNHRLHTLIEQCMQRFEFMANRSDICARASVILRQVLSAGNLGTTNPPSTNGDLDIISSSQKAQDNPAITNFHSGHQPSDLDGWNFTPELEALLFNAAPQQWIAPSSFMWNHWDTMTSV